MLKSLLVLVAVFAMLCNALYAQNFRAENVLPEKTLLVLEITDGKKFCEGMRSIGLWKFFEDPQWKEFFKTVPPQFMEMLHWQIKAAEKQAGISLQDLHQAFAGQLCLALVDVKMMPGVPFPIPVVLLSWDLGPKKEMFEKFFTETRQKLYPLAPMPLEEKTSDVNGYAVTTITAPMPIFLTYMGNTLLLCNNQEYLASILNKQEESFPSLAKSEQYNAVQQKLLQGYEGAYLYLNLKDAVKTGMNFLGPKAHQAAQVMEISGLDKLHAFAVGLSFRDEQIVESFYTYTPEGRTGIIAGILPNAQASKHLLKYLPQNVFGFNHGTFDLQGLYQTLLDVVKVFEPHAFDQAMAQKKAFEEKLGFQVEEFLASLGKEYLFSVNFSGGFIPDIAFQWSLANPQKFQEIAGKLLTLVPPKFQYNVVWNGYKFTYFNFSTKNQPIPVAPTFSIQEDRLILTLFPESLKNLLTHEKGSLPKDLLKVLKNSSYTAIEYWKFKDVVSILYRTAVPILQGMLPRHEIPVEPALLPSAEVVEKYFGNTIFMAVHDKEGLLWEMHSPTGTLPFAIASGFISYHMQRQMYRPYEEPQYEEPKYEEKYEEPQVEEHKSEESTEEEHKSEESTEEETEPSHEENHEEE